MSREWLVELNKDLTDLDELRRAAPPEAWNIVVCRRGEDPVCEPASDRNVLLTKLREMVTDSTVTHLFVFGRSGRCPITKGKFKYLILGDERLSLFSAPDQLEADLTGSLDDDDDSEPAPAPPPA